MNISQVGALYHASDKEMLRAAHPICLGVPPNIYWPDMIVVGIGFGALAGAVVSSMQAYQCPRTSFRSRAFRL